MRKIQWYALQFLFLTGAMTAAYYTIGPGSEDPPSEELPPKALHHNPPVESSVPRELLPGLPSQSNPLNATKARRRSSGRRRSTQDVRRSRWPKENFRSAPLPSNLSGPVSGISKGKPIEKKKSRRKKRSAVNLKKATLTTKDRLQRLKFAIIRYEGNYGTFRPSPRGLEVLVFRGVAAKQDIRDGWGRVFGIRQVYGTGRYTFYSKGPDGVANTPDDIQ